MCFLQLTPSDDTVLHCGHLLRLLKHHTDCAKHILLVTTSESTCQDLLRICAAIKGCEVVMPHFPPSSTSHTAWCAWLQQVFTDISLRPRSNQASMVLFIADVGQDPSVLDDCYGLICGEELPHIFTPDLIRTLVEAQQPGVSWEDGSVRVATQMWRSIKHNLFSSLQIAISVDCSRSSYSGDMLRFPGFRRNCSVVDVSFAGKGSLLNLVKEKVTQLAGLDELLKLASTDRVHQGNVSDVIAKCCEFIHRSSEKLAISMHRNSGLNMVALPQESLKHVLDAFCERAAKDFGAFSAESSNLSAAIRMVNEVEDAIESTVLSIEEEKPQLQQRAIPASSSGN